MIDAMSIRSRLPLVGRGDELARARRALGLDDAVEHPGGLLLLSGDAGIGKTSIVTSLADEALAAGLHRVLIGHCVGEAGTALPYLPFVEMFARFDDAEPDVVDRLLDDHPGISRLLPRRSHRERPGEGDGSADADRGRVLEAVHGALEDLARDRPLLVVIEDLHWADESSRDVLTVLFTRGFTGPVSLVATYRSDDLHRRHPLRRSLSLWARLPDVSRVELEPLPDPDIADLIRRLPERLSPDAVDGIVRRAEGNAFFAEELAAATAHGVAADPLDLSRLLLARVELLDEDAQEVVRVAAVVGRRVPQALLERVAGVAGAPLERLVREAVEHHVLEPAGPDGYAFRHALLAEAVYDDLLPSERLRLHRACSSVLQEDPTMGTAADLARHAMAAGETEVAVRASVAAGEGALAVGGPAEALAHFEEGLHLLREDDGSGHVLTVGAAEAALRLGRTNRSLALLRARLDDPRVIGVDRADLLGRLAYVLRVTEHRGDPDALTSEAVRLLDGAAPARRVFVLTRRVEYLVDVGRYDEAASVAQVAMEAAAEMGEGTHADLTTVVARLSEEAGNPAESIRRLEDLVARSATDADLPIVRAMHAIGWVHYRQENLVTALAAYRKAADRADELGLGWAPYGIDARVMAITVAYELGEWDLALGLADLGAQEPPGFARAAIDAAAAYVHAARGSDLPIRWYPRLREFWKRDGMHAIQSGAAAVDALGYAGDVAGAVAAHGEVVDYVHRLWEMPTFAAEVRLAALLLGRLAGAAPRLSTRERGPLLADAEALHARATAVFAPETPRAAPNTEGRAWTARVTAEHLRLRRRAGLDVDPEEHRSAWERAVVLFERRGDPYETARSQAGLAEALAAAGARDAAADMAAAARVRATALGARPLLADLARLGLPGSAGTPGDPASTALTPRELEVLAQIAQGRSNGQIGSALFISPKTASVHVSNILAKLGAASRGEAAAIGRERGLLP